MSDDIIEQMARAQYQIALDYLGPNAAGLEPWERLLPEVREGMLSQSRAAYAIARLATLEEAAKMAEKQPSRTAVEYYYGIAIADAIRKLAGEV